MSKDIDLTGLSVTIAIPVRNARDITVPTAMSLVATVNELTRYGVQHETTVTQGDIVTHARSYLAHRFLQGDKNRMFFIDSDLGWKAQDFIKLLAYSTAYDVIGAGYRAKRDPPFYLVHLGDDIRADERGCLECKDLSYGLGFTCIQRRVIEHMHAKAPVRKHTLHKQPFPDVFRFDRIGDEGELRGEDFTFLADCREAGFTTKIDPSIEIGHLGDKLFIGQVKDIIVPATPAVSGYGEDIGTPMAGALNPIRKAG